MGKLMTIQKALHPKSNVSRLYLPMISGGRGLLGIEDTVAQAIVNLDCYFEQSIEELIIAMLKGVESVKYLKKRQKREKFESWKGYLFRDNLSNKLKKLGATIDGYS